MFGCQHINRLSFVHGSWRFDASFELSNYWTCVAECACMDAGEALHLGHTLASKAFILFQNNEQINSFAEK